MSVSPKDIYYHLPATRADDDDTKDIGGAIDKTGKMSFKQLGATGILKARSESAADTTQDLTPYGRNTAGEKINEVLSLNGQSEVDGSTSFKALMKVLKDAECAGAVAVYSSQGQVTGTADSGSTDSMVLEAADDEVEDFYKGCVIITTAGTGDNQIREALYSRTDGTNTTVYFRTATAVSSDTVYLLADGVVFENAVNEIDEVRIAGYDVAAEAEGGSDKYVVEKFFIFNNSAQALTNSVVKKLLTGIEAGAVSKTIDNDDAVDKSGGKTGIPLTAHGFSTGAMIEVNGTTNYDGAYTVDATSSTDEIVVTATYSAENFGGTETVRNANVSFALETTLDGSGKNGAANNRYVLPPSGVSDFNSLDKDVPNSGTLSADSAVGVWLMEHLPAGAEAVRNYVEFQITGQSDAA